MYRNISINVSWCCNCNFKYKKESFFVDKCDLMQRCVVYSREMQSHVCVSIAEMCHVFACHHEMQRCDMYSRANNMYIYTYLICNIYTCICIYTDAAKLRIYVYIPVMHMYVYVRCRKFTYVFIYTCDATKSLFLKLTPCFHNPKLKNRVLSCFHSSILLRFVAYVHLHIWMCIEMRIHTYMRTHAHTYAYTQTHAHLTHKHTHAHTRANMHT